MPSTATDRLNGLTASVAVKAPVRAVTTAAITLSGLQTVGGVALAADDRVLVKNQTDTTENGIYLASSSEWTRALDFDGNRDAVRGTIVVANIDNGEGLLYRTVATDPIVIGTSSITFAAINDPNRTYGLTEAEALEGITPLNYSIESHDVSGHVNVFRYMTAAQMADVVGRTFTLDVTAAIQTAIDLAESMGATLSGQTVYLPAGTYKITSTVTVPSNNPELDGIKLCGAGKTTTIIKASGALGKMIVLGDLTQQSIRGCVQDLCVDGNSIAEYGIYGARVEEHDFVRVWARYTTIAAISIGYGYVNNYHQCECSYNTGDGLVFNIDFGSANNANCVSQCLLFSNEGWGFKGSGGHGVWFKDCTVEQNKKGGLFINGISAVYVNGYFEGNGLTGHTWTTPALTVKCDILFGGGSFTEMTAAFATLGAVIESCVTDPRATSDAFVWNAGVNDLTVRNCKTNQPTYVPVVAEHYNNSYKGSNVTVENCTSFNSQIEQIGASSAINNTFAAYIKNTGSTLKVQHRNYALTDMNQWTQLAAGSTTTYRRSTGAGLKKLHQADVWEFLSGATGSSDTMGFSIDAADYPELNGRTVWYGMWVYITNADCYIRPHCSAQSFNANPTTLNTWTLLAVSFEWPASGTLTFGAFKAGTATGSGYIAAPMLCLLGLPHEEAIGLIPKSRQWMGSAAPTDGTWEDGDIIWNTAPASGGAPGWVCTTPGSTGVFVFKAMANLA